MGEATVWGRELASSSLPGVCVVTGVPTDSTARVRFRTVPGWTWVFIIFGLLPVIIIQLLTQKTARGRVPMIPARRRWILLVQWTTAVAIVFAVVLVIVGAGQSDQSLGGTLALTGGLLLLAGIGLGVVGGAIVRVRGRVYQDPRVPDRWVVLHGVHPDFVAALESFRQGPGQPTESTRSTASP